MKYNDTSLFSMEFVYHFSMDFPETVVMVTPPMIHNQIFPANILNQKPPLELDMIKKTGSISQMAFDHFRANAESQLPILHRDGLPIPSYDDWVEDNPPKGYRTLVKFMLHVDPALPKEVLNLQHIGEWKFNDSVIDYMKQNTKAMTVPYESIFLCNQYRWDNLLEMSSVHIDDDLNITIDDDMGLRDIHHHVIYVVNDPSMLHEQAVSNLIEHPKVTKDYLITLYPFMKDKLHEDQIKNWSTQDWYALLDYIRNLGYKLYVGDQFLVWNLVGNFTVNTTREH